MAASYGKLTAAHEEAIYDLKKADDSGRVIREKLAAGYKDLDPVKISGQQANKVARRLLDERDELYSSKIQTKPAPEGLRLLTRRLMIIAERETMRLERQEKAGKLDAAKLGKLAGAVTKLHGLLERNDEFEPDPPPPGLEAGGGEDGAGSEASEFEDDLLAGDGDAVPSEPPPGPGQGAPAAIGDVLVREDAPSTTQTGGDAVPSDPPPTGDGRHLGPRVGTGAVVV